MGASVAENASDLKQLPLRALVAYAARCARRVQSQYKPPEGHADAAACVAAIEAAIRVAEQFAFGEETTREIVTQAEEAAVRAMLLVSGEENGNSTAAYAANAAYAAIDAATAGLAALEADDPAPLAEKVVAAAAIAFDAASAIRSDVARPARLDWEILHRMHLGKFPTVGAPINPAESGILGPLFSKADGAAAKRQSHAKNPPKQQPESAPAAAPSPAPQADSAPPRGQGPSPEEMQQAAGQLRQKHAALCALETELEQQREALEADRTALNAVNDELERRRVEVERDAARLELERARGSTDEKAAQAAAQLLERQQEFERRENDLEGERTRLRAERDKFLEEIERFQADKGELLRLREDIDCRAAQHSGIEAEIQKRKEEAEAQWSRLEAERQRLDDQAALQSTQVADLVEREEHLRSQQAKLEEDRAAFLARNGEIDRSSAELRESTERIRNEKNQLRTQQDELRAKQAEFLAREETLEEERRTHRSEADRLALDAEKSAAAAEDLRVRQEEFERRRDALAAREEELAERQAQMGTAAQRHHGLETALAKERDEVEKRERELDERRRLIDKETADLKAQAARVEADLARLESQQEELKVAQDDLRDERVAAESARQHLEHDRQKLRETVKQVDGDKKKCAEQHAQFEADQRALKLAREEAEAARSELRQQNEKFEAARVAFMEDRAQVAKKEADIHKALKQLRDERKELQPENDSLKSWSLHQTPKETVADLQVLVSRLQDERHRLKIEREQLAEVFSLISRGGRKGALTASRPRAGVTPSISLEGPRLRMILEAGTASSGDLTELLAELSSLNRRLGGPGVEFVINECRTWRLPSPQGAGPSSGASSGPSREVPRASAGERSFVEIYAIPRPSALAQVAASASESAQSESSPERDGAAPGAAHWDRFTASLFMVLRLDAGQANYFELAEAAAAEHPSYVLASDAARRAAEKSARSAEGKNAAPAESSVDAINSHLQKIDELRRKLEREDSLVLELAPAVDRSPDETPNEPAAPLPRQNRRRLVSLAIAAASLLLAAGIMYAFWPVPFGKTHSAAAGPIPAAVK